MFRWIVFSIAVIALLLAGFSVWTNSRDDYAVSDHTHPQKPALACTDGAFDKDLQCWNEDTVFAVRDVIRPLFVRYVDADDNLVATVSVPAIIASDAYVVTSRLVIPPTESGIHIFDAYLVAIPEDRGAQPEKLGAPTAVDEALGLVAFPRPNPTLLTDPITLGAYAEVSTTDQLVVPAVDLAVAAYGNPLTVIPTGNVRDRGAGNTLVFLANAMPTGTPVFTLRDGVPEFVGMVAGAGQVSSLVITTQLIADYFQHLAIPVPPEFQR